MSMDAVAHASGYHASLESSECGTTDEPACQWLRKRRMVIEYFINVTRRETIHALAG
jgi:hypothetical protein